MRSVAVVGIVALGACGDEQLPVCNRDGGAACFELPSEAIATYRTGGGSPPALIGCGPVLPTSSTMAISLAGNVTDYSSAQPIAGVTLQVFDAGDYANAIATATTDNSGAYSMNLASGTPDVLWGMLAGNGVVPHLVHQMRLELGQATLTVDYTMGTPELLDTVDNNVGVDRDPGLARLVVHVLDCNRYSLVNAVVVLSATAGVRDFVDGVPVFYSVVGTDFPLPVEHEQVGVTGTDGTAVLINVPIDGSELYAQAWGFPDAAAVARGEDGLVLIAEHAVARRAATTTWVNLRSNQND